MKKSLFFLLITFACTQATTIDVEPVPGSPFSAGATDPTAFSFSPNGKFAAVTNLADDTVSSYTVDPDTGQLSIASDSVAAGTSPFQLAFSPDSTFLAVSNDDSVSMYSVDQMTGELTLVDTAMVPVTGAILEGIRFRPDGLFLAVGRRIGIIGSLDAKIVVFSVNQTTGVLAEIGGSPFPTNVVDPTEVALDYSADGRFLGVTFRSNQTPNFEIFSVDQNSGAPTSIGTFTSSGTLPKDISYLPSGGFFAIANQTSNNVSIFAYDETTGIPTEITDSPFASGSTNTLSVSYSPNSFYLGVYSAPNAPSPLAIFQTQSDGSITPLTDIEFGVNEVNRFSFYFNGLFVGSTNSGNNSIAVFRLNIPELGSDTQVELIKGKPTLSNGSRIATFASLEDGFELANEATEVTYDSVFPVSGEVSLEGGTLNLNRNLTLVDDGRIESMGSIGSIDTQDHTLTLAFGTSLVPEPRAGALTRALSATPCVQWGDMTLTLNSDITLNDTCITFTGNSVINGQGHVLTIDATSCIQIGQNSTLLMTNVIVEGIKMGNVVPLDATSTLTLQNTEWFLVEDNTYSFTQGTLDIEKQVTISGKDTIFTYASDQVSTIGKNARLQLNNGLIFNYDPSAGPDRLQLLTNNSTIFLNGATLQASAVGLQLERGILLVGRKSFVSSAGTTFATGIKFGDGVLAENNLTIDILPAAQLEFTQGFIVENGV